MDVQQKTAKNFMKLVLMLVFSLAMVLFAGPKIVYAASEADCAIWICLPGGFPSGCGAAQKAFHDRLKHGRSPLPELWSCSTGPNGERVSGNYQLGREVFEACTSGYILREDNRSGFLRGKCYLAQCAPEKYMDSNEIYCRNYEALRRSKQSYIKMWVNGDYLGQFWYQ